MKAALPMNRFQTRLASLSDLAAICAIEDISFSVPYPRSLLEELLQECSQSFFVATNDAGKILGYCVCSISGISAHLISIAVDDSLRRKGVATKLLRRAIESLNASGIDEFWLEVKMSNLEAIGLYLKFGFKNEAVLKAYYSDGSDALRMHLVLPALNRARREGNHEL
jgi:ribosomal-protein-alanine N-acetyltransferase